MANNGTDTVIKQPGWWRRRNRLEKVLGIMVLFSLIVIICLATGLATVLAAENHPRSESLINRPFINHQYLIAQQNKVKLDDKLDNAVCLSPGCVLAANNLIKNMDITVDPCEDFYDFACGNFIKTTRIPDDMTTVDAFSVISEFLQDQLRTVLEQDSTPNEPKAFGIAKDVYKACMNTELIEETGNQTLLDLVEKLGGWPVLKGDSWSPAGNSWMDLTYKMNDAGFSARFFMEVSIGPDCKNSTHRVLSLDQASLGINRKYFMNGLNDEIVTAYYNYMVDIAVLLGANRSFAEKELNRSLLFEAELAKMSLAQEEMRNATALYNPMTVSEMQQKFPSMQWKDFFNSILRPYSTITDDDVVIISYPKYISNYEKLMKIIPKRVMANYAMWRAIEISIPFVSEKFKQRNLVFQGVMTGVTAKLPRWKECSSMVNKGLGIATGSMYVRKYFDDKAKNIALDMVNDIRKEFRHILQEVEWMDEKTRAAALEKADTVVPHIAYPQELLDDHKIDEFYDGLVVSPKSYLYSMLNNSVFFGNYKNRMFREPINRTEWISHGQPAVVNAFYNAVENSIQFPAGVLQGDMFSAQRPRYMNYGAIGFVIAHEITHGFDDQGSQFDKDGNLVDWWAEQTKTRYLEKANCIIQQYSNYTVKEVNLNLNGINTQGENIADNGGIKEVYSAYLKWVKRNGEEPALPGLPFTPKQLFWMSAANIWCSVMRPQSLQSQIQTEVHSPGRFRVLGPISNMPQFSEDFNCPLGSKMNPVHKCNVW